MSSIPSSLGLLSGYNTSSSDEDEVVESTSSTTRSNSLVNATSTSEDKAKHHNKKDNTVETSEPLPLPYTQPSFRLPAPCLGTQSGISSSSVFSNPFQDEQQAQRTILERHVKLSDGNWTKGGKGICLVYQRDGRCRFGTKCKYSHGSDLPLETTVSTQKEVQGKEMYDEAWEVHPGGSVMTRDGQDEDVQIEKGKRKKPGLTNTLIPPKKTLKNYEKQLSSERPWAL